jgi:hypothetical protein
MFTVVTAASTLSAFGRPEENPGTRYVTEKKGASSALRKLPSAFSLTTCPRSVLDAQWQRWQNKRDLFSDCGHKQSHVVASAAEPREIAAVHDAEYRPSQRGDVHVCRQTSLHLIRLKTFTNFAGEELIRGSMHATCVRIEPRGNGMGGK